MDAREGSWNWAAAGVLRQDGVMELGSGWRTGPQAAFGRGGGGMRCQVTSTSSEQQGTRGETARALGYEGREGIPARQWATESTNRALSGRVANNERDQGWSDE